MNTHTAGGSATPLQPWDQIVGLKQSTQALSSSCLTCSHNRCGLEGGVLPAAVCGCATEFILSRWPDLTHSVAAGVIHGFQC
jgi:hypothetical protein